MAAMVRRLIAVILGMVLLAGALAQAETGGAAQLSDAVVFERAMQLLQHINQPESVAQAAEVFDSITSDYGSSNLFSGYAKAVSHIHSGDLDGAENYLQVLKDYDGFDALAQSYQLPGAGVLLNYIAARRAELAGRVDVAFDMFLSMDALDSFDRAVALRDSAFELRYSAGVALFDQGDYEGAEKIFLALDNYRDSAEWAARAHMMQTAPTATPLPQPTPQSATQPPAPIGRSVVSFGSYEQDGDPANGAEPVQWLLLREVGNSALLLSLYALDVQPYNSASGRTAWAKCSLRSWLNGDFLNAAFTPEEREWIEAEPTANAGKNAFGVDGGADTRDPVFLLTVQDAFDAALLDDAERMCKATPYARGRGARAEGEGRCWWWLRTPGSDGDAAAYVSLNGMVVEGGTKAVSGDVCVRPALWVKLRE